MLKFKTHIIVLIVVLLGVGYFVCLESSTIHSNVLVYYYEHSALEVYNGKDKKFYSIKNGQLENKGLSISALNNGSSNTATFYIIDPKSRVVTLYSYNKEKNELDIMGKADEKLFDRNKGDIIWSSSAAVDVPFYRQSKDKAQINYYAKVKDIDDGRVLVEDEEAFYVLHNQNVEKLIDKNKSNFIGDTDKIYFLTLSSKNKSAIFISDYKPWDLLKGTRWRYFFVDLNSKKVTILYPKDIIKDFYDHLYVLGVIDD